MATKNSSPATKDDLKKLEKALEKQLGITNADLHSLEERLEKRIKEEIAASEIRTNIKLEKLEQKIDDKARQYRDQILTKLDEVMGELISAREEREFMNHDIKDHEKRITKLEQF